MFASRFEFNRHSDQPKLKNQRVEIPVIDHDDTLYTMRGLKSVRGAHLEFDPFCGTRLVGYVYVGSSLVRVRQVATGFWRA